METFEIFWSKFNEYWIPKSIFLIMEQMLLALEKLVNDSLMDLKRHIFATLFKSNFIMIV
jgi:hypothetical protein